MTGAMSRNKGNRAMLAVVKWFHANGFPHAAKRSAGENGDDILQGFPLVSIEVKDQATMALSAWVDQATGQAEGRPAIVIHKRKMRTDVGDWYVTMTLRDFAEVVR
jgi:hypothetical protein